MHKIILVLKSASHSRVEVPLFFMAAIILAVLELLSVGAIPAFITVVFSPSTAVEYLVKYFPSFNLQKLEHFPLVLRIGGLLVILLIMKGILALLISLYQASRMARFQANLSSLLLKCYLSWPYERYLMINSAELIRNTVSIPVSIVTGVVNSLAIIFTEIFLVFLIAMGLLYVSPAVTLSTIAVLGVSISCFYLLLKTRLSNLGARVNQASVKTMQWINQSLGGAKEIRVLGCESYFHEHYLTNFLNFSRATLFSSCIAQAPRYFLEVIAVLGMLILTLTLMISGGGSEELLPTIALFGAVSLRLIPSANRIWGGIASIRANLNSIEIFERDILEFSEEIPADEVNDWTLENEMVVQELTYIYTGSDRAALDSISMVVKCNSTVGIAGRSGAGKSTLLDIFLGLHEATIGDILIDGNSISKNLNAWRKRIGYVPQQIFIIDDSIRRNVALGLEDSVIDDSLVKLALRKACLDDFVDTLPQGLDTRLGERGARLSGGQRQRIGIARALYRKPEILFLDEPTSALDSETEQSIIETLERLHETITIVIIAHHYEMMRLCDTVYVLDQGRLVETGTADKLQRYENLFK